MLSLGRAAIPSASSADRVGALVLGLSDEVTQSRLDSGCCWVSCNVAVETPSMTTRTAALLAHKGIAGRWLGVEIGRTSNSAVQSSKAETKSNSCEAFREIL